GSGECTSTVKTTKAGTYNVWVALVPAGAAQPVSPVKTALVFLADWPNRWKTTVSTDKSAANADKNETITVKIVPRDSYGNIVPLWTFSKALTITPSPAAFDIGAVTVSPPTADAMTGEVRAVLKFVGTFSDQWTAKLARGGTTDVDVWNNPITVDTRFYPEVHVCLVNLSTRGYVIPGKTEVRLCDGRGEEVEDGSGYTVTAPGISSAGCPTTGGGVCPSDVAGVESDFQGLSGDDIRTLASTRVKFRIHDNLAGQAYDSYFTTGKMVFYGVLKHPYGPTNLGSTRDLFRTTEAGEYCKAIVRSQVPGMTQDEVPFAYDEVLHDGKPVGGTTTADSTMGSLYTGNIALAAHSGGWAAQEIFTDGSATGIFNGKDSEYYNTDVTTSPGIVGMKFPDYVEFVNGEKGISANWSMSVDGATMNSVGHSLEIGIGYTLSTATSWDLSDAYYVNSVPGTPYASQKGNGDWNYIYVTQVNYITGYICAARLN
ncbi:hypothetical protein EKA58_24610, partial [Salmonella enterica subsp. enterica serovar Panama]|nr:hypothetical protein [Salmonella enterica]ECA3581118.1 hypothetical protein [Salmonella enterica subsp. enterica serovar Panama]